MIRKDNLIPVRRPDIVLIIKKKGTCHLTDFAVQVDHKVKTKENKRINKDTDLAGERKRKRSIRLTIIPIGDSGILLLFYFSKRFLQQC